LATDVPPNFITTVVMALPVQIVLNDSRRLSGRAPVPK
jgi:hypothetical protein